MLGHRRHRFAGWSVPAWALLALALIWSCVEGPVPAAAAPPLLTGKSKWDKLQLYRYYGIGQQLKPVHFFTIRKERLRGPSGPQYRVYNASEPASIEADTPMYRIKTRFQWNPFRHTVEIIQCYQGSCMVEEPDDAPGTRRPKVRVVAWAQERWWTKVATIGVRKGWDMWWYDDEPAVHGYLKKHYAYTARTWWRFFHKEFTSVCMGQNGYFDKHRNPLQRLWTFVFGPSGYYNEGKNTQEMKVTGSVFGWSYRIDDNRNRPNGLLLRTWASSVPLVRDTWELAVNDKHHHLYYILLAAIAESKMGFFLPF